MDKLLQQAHQGSVAAIMQILNEQLRESGVQTKAVLEKGILQLRCEAEHPENFDQTVLVTIIHRTLEKIAPQNFKQIHIQCRLTNQQQALWAETLTPDARDRLLWSQEIQLVPPPKVKKIDQRSLRGEGTRSPTTNYFWLQVLLSAGLGISLFGLGFIIHDWWDLRVQTKFEFPRFSPSNSQIDPFYQAVRLANQAGIDGQTAQTYREWIDLAHRWQQAVDLMKTVPKNHPRYTEAQERVLSYRQNSEVALAKAQAASKIHSDLPVNHDFSFSVSTTP